MEGLRIVLAAGFFGLAALALYLFGQTAPGISVADAQLTPMGDSFMLTARIENAGRPDRLTGIGSEAAATVGLTGGTTEALTIPAASAPSLSADGAHAMVSGLLGGETEGRLVPMSFWFEGAGAIPIRARIVPAQEMDHAVVFDVPDGEPEPTLSLRIEQTGATWQVIANTENFAFSQDAADGPHEPGVGHAHLYLNGLKLQRMYTPMATIGALPPGTYKVQVTLNTNDHRIYSVDGQPVAATAELIAD